jgi:hypothetical protein
VSEKTKQSQVSLAESAENRIRIANKGAMNQSIGTPFRVDELTSQINHSVSEARAPPTTPSERRKKICLFPGKP